MSKHFDPWAPVLRNVVLPLYYLRHGDKRFQRFRELEENQWMTVDRLEALQLQRINRILSHAYETTRFYRERLTDCGLYAGPIGHLSELQRLTPVSKADLQERSKDMISSAFPFSSLIVDSSGGSTGIPTTFYKDKERHNLRRADQMRHDRWSGWNVGDRWALVWGARSDLVDQRSYRERFVERYLHHSLTLDAFELTEEKTRNFAHKLRNFQPKMILGYANALGQLASFIIANGMEESIRPRGVISSAESLSTDVRQKIQRAFGCPVLDRYGSREVGLIASECGSGAGMHINADNLLVEVLSSGAPVNTGESGNVVITDLWNFGMPLIRYDMGDRAITTDEACPCGRKLPLLKSVQGRSSDFLRAQDGTKIHGEYFTHLFYGSKTVSQFQIVQESITDVTVSIVPADQRSTCQIDDIVEDIQQILGNGIRIAVNFCESIPPTPSGKFRFTISKV